MLSNDADNEPDGIQRGRPPAPPSRRSRTDRNSQLRSPLEFRSISEGFYVELKVAKYVTKET